MEPRTQNVTQTAIHVTSGEGKSLWTLGQLLTFKIHDRSSPRGMPPDMDRLQASAWRTGGVELNVPSEEAGP